MIARITTQSIVGAYPIVRHHTKTGVGITVDMDLNDIRQAILSFSETMSEAKFREILNAIEDELEYGREK
jgi:hypothetical protein